MSHVVQENAFVNGDHFVSAWIYSRILYDKHTEIVSIHLIRKVVDRVFASVGKGKTKYLNQLKTIREVKYE